MGNDTEKSRLSRTRTEIAIGERIGERRPVVRTHQRLDVRAVGFRVHVVHPELNQHKVRLRGARRGQ